MVEDIWKGLEGLDTVYDGEVFVKGIELDYEFVVGVWHEIFVLGSYVTGCLEWNDLCIVCYN